MPQTRRFSQSLYRDLSRGTLGKRPLIRQLRHPNGGVQRMDGGPGIGLYHVAIFMASRPPARARPRCQAGLPLRAPSAAWRWGVHWQQAVSGERGGGGMSAGSIQQAGGNQVTRELRILESCWTPQGMPRRHGPKVDQEWQALVSASRRKAEECRRSSATCGILVSDLALTR